MPTSHSTQVREAAEANDEEDPDAKAPPAALAPEDDPMPDVPRGMARPLQLI